MNPLHERPRRASRNAWADDYGTASLRTGGQAETSGTVIYFIFISHGRRADDVSPEHQDGFARAAHIGSIRSSAQTTAGARPDPGHRARGRGGLLEHARGAVPLGRPAEHRSQREPARSAQPVAAIR